VRARRMREGNESIILVHSEACCGMEGMVVFVVVDEYI
jgi:hypothetical protein